MLCCAFQFNCSMLYFFSSQYIVQSLYFLWSSSLQWHRLLPDVDGKKLGRQVFCRCRGIDPSDPVFVLCHSFVFPNVSVLYLCWPRWPCIGIRIHLLPLLFLRVFFAPGLLPAVVTPYFPVLLQEGSKANDRMELIRPQCKMILLERSGSREGGDLSLCHFVIRGKNVDLHSGRTFCRLMKFLK